MKRRFDSSKNVVTWQLKVARTVHSPHENGNISQLSHPLRVSQSKVSCVEVSLLNVMNNCLSCSTARFVISFVFWQDEEIGKLKSRYGDMESSYNQVNATSKIPSRLKNFTRVVSPLAVSRSLARFCRRKQKKSIAYASCPRKILSSSCGQV